MLHDALLFGLGVATTAGWWLVVRAALDRRRRAAPPPAALGAESLLDAMLIVDREGTITQANDLAERLVGGGAPLVGHAVETALPGIEAALVAESGTLVLDHARTERWLECRWTAHGPPDSGRAIAVRDVTARRMAEVERKVRLGIAVAQADTRDLDKLLAHAEQAVAHAFRAEGAFVVLFDLGTGLPRARHHGLERVGAPVHAGLAWYTWRQQQTLAVEAAGIRDLVARGQVNATGDPPGRWLATPLRTPGGAIGVVAVQDAAPGPRWTNRDRELLEVIAVDLASAVTHRTIELEGRAMRESVALAERRFRELVAAVPGVVWRADPTTHRFTLVSPHAEAMLGHPAERWIDEPDFWRAHIHPDDREWASEFAARAVRQLRGCELEYRMIAADGRVIHVRDLANVIVEGGRAREIVGVMFDVTHGKQLEAELARHTELLEAVVENIPAMLAVSDPQGRVTLINRAFERGLGWNLLECQSTDILAESYPDPAVRAEVLDHIAAYDGRWKAFEERTRDGRRRVHAWAHVRLSDGTAISIGQDITDRTRDARAAAEGRRRLELVMWGAALGYWDWDIDTGLRFENERVADILGFPAVARTTGVDRWVERLHPDDRDRAIDAVHALASGASDQYSIEYRLRTADGAWRWVLDSGRVVARDESGRPARAAGVFSDIDDRRSAEERLQETTRFMQQMLDASPSMIFVVDRDGRLVFANRACAAYYGTTPDSLVERATTEIHHDGSEAIGFLEDDRRVVDEGVKVEREEENTAPDGARHWFHTVKVPLVRADGQVHVLGIATDVTARRQAEAERATLEDQMRHAQKLESLGVLAGGIAHDFNNLLAAVMGNASIAAERAGRDPELRQAIREIETASQRASELTHQMLAYSGGGAFAQMPLDLSELVREMISLLRTVISKKATVRLELEPAYVEADRGQLQQIVMNLITNASEALRAAGGTITLRTGRREVRGPDLQALVAGTGALTGSCAYLEVEDTGEGMDTETRERMFDPFFTTKFTGRGLGLAAVLGIVRGHRGALQVWSTPGKGTLFVATFPAIAAPAVLPVPQAPARREVPGGTVLVVDDETQLRTLVRRVLTRAGYDVIDAPDGHVAVQVFRAHPDISAVVLDLTMPHMDGWEVLAQLRELRPDIPVLLVSGFNEPEIPARFVDQRRPVFLHKPFDPRELVESLERARVVPA